MQKIIFIVFFSIVLGKSYSQTSDTSKAKSFEKNLCLLTGINYGKQVFIDLGISVNSHGTAGYHSVETAYYLASEFHFTDKPIIGPKIGAWISGGASAIVVGLNIIYYTDFDESSLVFRPEIGFGFDKFKITYGYNAKLTNTSFDRIPQSIIGLTYCFKLKKLRAANSTKKS